MPDNAFRVPVRQKKKWPFVWARPCSEKRTKSEKALVFIEKPERRGVPTLTNLAFGGGVSK